MTKMYFRNSFSAHFWLLFYLTVNLNMANASSSHNDYIFKYQDLDSCRRNEFYDLNFFACVPCTTTEDANELLQPAADKFSCECRRPTTLPPATTTTKVYQANRPHPTCAATPACHDSNNATATTTSRVKPLECLPANIIDAIETGACRFKYLNTSRLAKNESGTGQQPLIQLSAYNPHNYSDCTCDIRYNFRYQNYCIATVLLRPYLRYNSYWQAVSMGGSTSSAAHFGDLKYVAFFCLSALQNATACQQLANLCVLSHYSFDKNSPCGAFLLDQAADAAYATSMDDQQAPIRPFLFYRRGKTTARLLSQPLEGAAPYSLDASPRNQLRFVGTTHALDGTLRRYDSFKLLFADLCGTHARSAEDNGNVRFANDATKRQRQVLSDCWLTLEQLIDLAQRQANDNFVSLFLNYSKQLPEPNSDDAPLDRSYLQAVPILIEDLTAANQRPWHAEEWQLVKRFQLIQSHVQHHNRAAAVSPDQQRPYVDAHKLHVYRTLRYVAAIELQYKIHAGNRISLPLLRLRYRTIQLQPANNATALAERCPFRMSVYFELAAPPRTALSAATLPALLLLAVALAGLRACNIRRRQRAARLTVSGELCDFAGLWEFLLRLISNAADALLIAYLIHVVNSAVRFLMRRTVESALPLQQFVDEATLGVLIYAALLLKSVFLAVHLWHISHVDMFFVDWERPRNYDSNHFNLKSNLETSSLCSSVRTFVSECNVSAWRVFFAANEWIRLSGQTRTSALVRCLALLAAFELLDRADFTHGDLVLQLFLIAAIYVTVQLAQLLFSAVLAPLLFGRPLQHFVDVCALANVSVFTLLESASYGFYIHGRSPHGFADTDMSSMVLQLQREAQNMCGRRGLLSDSDQQTYVIVPPTNLRAYFEKLLVPFQRSCSISQAHYQKAETSSGGANSEGNLLERNSIAYGSVNRFFCAFIDHAIKDMDYIIKEKTFAEKLFDCEFDNYLTENKGTFYIDKGHSYAQLFLYGNQRHIFSLELLLILCLFKASVSLPIIIALVCVLNKLLRCTFRGWVRRNVAAKTLIDKRFLM